MTEYVFRVRKPFASATESALVAFLSKRFTKGTEWRFIPGTYWYRFFFPDWGYFSIAICSDLLDTFIWDWLRDRIQHLFVLSWNKDIDLFDQLSWTRCYELYANVVTVNHGENGGSIAWTPKRNHDKEIFRAHGKDLSLAVTVSLPLQELIEAQRGRFIQSVEEAIVMEWEKNVVPKEESGHHEAAAARDDQTQKHMKKFKPPPPGYPRFDAPD